MTNKDNYQLLIDKLDQFIRKYYINQLIRGSLYSLGLILLLFVGMNILEYYFYFPTAGRKVLFYSFIGISVLALFAWVFTPLLRYFRLGKTISHHQAATIIGNHFSNVKDKLLNILQLKQQADSAEDKELILASINQKTTEINPVPFRTAINLSQNRKYLRYALPPLLLLLIILLAAPSIIRDSTVRLINNNREYKRPAPFYFDIQEDQLSVVQFEDYQLDVKVEGEQLPDQVFIDIESRQYRLTKQEANLFSYKFSNVQKNTGFRLFSTGVESDDYTLNVLKKPNIAGFDVKLDYPAYTQRKDEELSSIGDLVVPAGTNIDWVFNAQNTDQINLKFSSQNELAEAKRFSDELFTFKKKALRNEQYMLYISNRQLPRADSISYTISVIPDQYPSISAEKFQDSLDQKLLFFVGEASDDYGLLNLSFNYRIKPENDEPGELQTFKISKPASKQLQFDHTFDMRKLELQPGDEVRYYFEVFDNDAVNGSKSARTSLMTYAMPTVKEYREQAEENDQQIKEDIQNALEESRKIQREMKEMREKLLQQKEMDWQSRKELEKLLERQRDLEKRIENAKESFEENLRNQQEFSEMDEELLKKQEQLQKLMEEVMSEEMKKLMRQLEELMQELEKEQALEMMEDFEFNDEEMEKELDRMLELFKQLEVEQEMKEAIKQLEELAEEQEELSEETKEMSEEEQQDAEEQEEGAEEKQSEEKSAEESEKENSEQEGENQPSAEQENTEQQEDQQQQGAEQQQQESDKQEQLEEKQKEIDEKFQDIKEQMEQMEQKNQELETPMNLGDQEQEMQDIQQDINDSQQQLQQQQNNKASESQKNASQKMKQMAQSMAMQMQSGQMQQMQEDMQALRQLLENLVGLSFDQEDLMDEFTETNINTPKYVDLVQQQFKLKDDFRLIEDSLQALSKRVFQIESFITEKVTEINGNMREGLEDLEERRKLQASDHQQRSMKNVNDLALMLSEVMNQMQQQMSSMMSGNQMCNNPGAMGQEGRQPKDKISKGQQSLNEQMQRMKEALEKGKGMSSKEFAEMAAKQAALRKALREKQRQLQEQGQGSKELQELIDQMDKVETELVNKRLNNDMLQRQQDILTRLLEHEKAERERKFDEQRKAETAQDKERKLPPSLEEYIKKRQAEIEMYKTVSPALKPYYKNLVEEYFKSLQSSQ